jgi:hypothetical protein
VRSSLSFWLAAAALVAGVAVLESGPAGAARNAAPLSQSQSLRRFLATEADGPLVPLRLRKVTSDDWVGWRFRVQGCDAAAVPLPTGGDFDVDARRRLRPGQRLVFVYRGQVYDQAPIALAGFRRYLDLAFAGQQAHAEDFYVGVITPRDCPAPIELPWGKLPAYGLVRPG